MAGLRFDVKDRESVERDALRLAVRDALARARAIASGAGATLGPIVRIDEISEPGPPGIYPIAQRMSASEATQTPISPGELEIRGQVTLTVSIR